MYRPQMGSTLLLLEALRADVAKNTLLEGSNAYCIQQANSRQEKANFNKK
jgi:hypothetical protein